MCTLRQTHSGICQNAAACKEIAVLDIAALQVHIGLTDPMGCQNSPLLGYDERIILDPVSILVHPVIHRKVRSTYGRPARACAVSTDKIADLIGAIVQRSGKFGHCGAVILIKVSIFACPEGDSVSHMHLTNGHLTVYRDADCLAIRIVVKAGLVACKTVVENLISGFFVQVSGGFRQIADVIIQNLILTVGAVKHIGVCALRRIVCDAGNNLFREVQGNRRLNPGCDQDLLRLADRLEGHALVGHNKLNIGVVHNAVPVAIPANKTCDLILAAGPYAVFEIVPPAVHIPLVQGNAVTGQLLLRAVYSRSKCSAVRRQEGQV